MSISDPKNVHEGDDEDDPIVPLWLRILMPPAIYLGGILLCFVVLAWHGAFAGGRNLGGLLVVLLLFPMGLAPLLPWGKTPWLVHGLYVAAFLLLPTLRHRRQYRIAVSVFTAVLLINLASCVDLARSLP